MSLTLLIPHPLPLGRKAQLARRQASDPDTARGRHDFRFVIDPAFRARTKEGRLKRIVSIGGVPQLPSARRQHHRPMPLY